MKKVKFVLCLFGLLLGVSVIAAAQNLEEPKEGKGKGTFEFEMVEIARVAIVSDAAWRCGKAFDPPVLEIKAGTTVEWTNMDREMHSLISSTGNQPCYLKPDPPRERFIGASQLPYQKTYKKRFDKPGEYQYACHLPSHHMA
ncbi:MAG TPA: plastocyanin/azurin family copper-binding protein, partial [Nitrospiria bacterium]|nr:plastocyanin/azurin family copper-binding protein [Nitrospiria bacterium]